MSAQIQQFGLVWRTVNVKVPFTCWGAPQWVVAVLKRFKLALLNVSDIIQPLGPQVGNFGVLPVVAPSWHGVHQAADNQRLKRGHRAGACKKVSVCVHVGVGGGESAKIKFYFPIKPRISFFLFLFVDFSPFQFARVISGTRKRHVQLKSCARTKMAIMTPSATVPPLDFSSTTVLDMTSAGWLRNTTSGSSVLTTRVASQRPLAEFGAKALVQRHDHALSPSIPSTHHPPFKQSTPKQSEDGSYTPRFKLAVIFLQNK